MIAKPFARSGRLSRARAQLEELLPTPALRDTFEEASASLEAGRLVRTMREMAGLTQQELADRLTIKQPRISAIESGRGRDGLTYALLKRIVLACGGRWRLPELLLGAMTEPAEADAAAALPRSRMEEVAGAAAMGTALGPAAMKELAEAAAMEEEADSAEEAEEAEAVTPRPFRS